MARRVGGEAGEARTAGSRRIAGATGLNLVTRVAQILTGLVALPVLARVLGPEELGSWVAATAYVGIWAGFTEFGLTSAAMLKMSSDPEHEAEWLSALASLRTILGVGLAVIAAAFVPLAISGTDARIAALILCLTILLVGAQALMSLFTARLRPGIPFAISLLQSALWLGCVTAFAILDAGLLTIAVTYTGMLAVIALVQTTVVRRHASVSLQTRNRWRELLRVAVPVGLASIFIAIYIKVDAILLHEIADPGEAGIYGVAYRFLDPLTFVPAAVMAAFFPVLAAIWQDEPERARRLTQRCFEILTALSVPAVAVTLALDDEIVRLVGGDGYERSAGLLPILMGAFVGMAYGTLAGLLAPVLGLQWRLALFAGIGALVNVVGNVLLIPDHGAYGSAWVTLATEAITMTLLLATCLRRMELRLAPGRPLRIVAAAALTFAAAAAAAPLGLLPGVLAAGIVYPVALLGLGGIKLDELRALRSA